MNLDSEKGEWFTSACRQLNSDRLRSLIAELTNRHSPTGQEREVAQYLVSYLHELGYDARYSAVSEDSGNCIVRIKGRGSGPTLMLYAPLDTHLENEEHDVPWVGRQLRPDMKPLAEIDGDLVVGLGASNPKSMVAAIVESVHAVVEAGVPLAGDLLIVCCGGGMPWRPPSRPESGLSSGVLHLFGEQKKPDCAVILKPVDDIYYEHPGLAWFRVTLTGSLGYAGMPRGIAEFRSSIVPAARTILELEQWLQEYPQKHQSEQVLPQGWISAIHAGWPDKPAFPSATCEICLDVRTTPDQTRESLEQEFGELMSGIQNRNPDLDIYWDLYEYCQGTRTNPDHPIVASAVHGWEATRGRAYSGAEPQSGQTDAATICGLGIPIVRIGYPFGEVEKLPQEFRDGLGGMGVARVSDLIDSCRHLIYMMIDLCARPPAEVADAEFLNQKH